MQLTHKKNHDINDVKWLLNGNLDWKKMQRVISVKVDFCTCTFGYKKKDNIIIL
jgi:acetone carboxylase gamma subunit